jgi:dienelactone hydrolase
MLRTLSALLLLLILQPAATGQIRITPGAAKGGTPQGNPWADVPASFREMKIPEWRLPTDRKRWVDVDRGKIRATLRHCLGEMPDRPDPRKVRVVSKKDQGDYIEERFEFDNGVDMTVPGIILIPKNRPQPCPAIIALHGHGSSKESVCTDAANQQFIGPSLARKGYVVAAIDGYFNGERIGKGPAGALEEKSGQESTLFKLYLWQGRTLWGMMLRDEQCLIDYLETRPEVNKQRIGATGMSMGCTRAWWLAAIEDRIRAIVGVACFTRYTELIAHGNIQAHGIYYFVPGLLQHFDTEAIYALVAPRPMLMLSGDQDGGAPTDGIEVLEKKLDAVYELYDRKTQFRSVVYKNTGHEYLPEMKEEMTRWFEQHLPAVEVEKKPDGKAPNTAVWEPWLDRKLLPAEEAQGMMQAFVEKQLEPLPLPRNLADWQKQRDKLGQDVLKILGLDDLIPAKWDLNLSSKGTLRRDGYRIEKITFETWPGFANAALLYIPDSVEGRVPGIVSISGHTPHSKAADYVQQRNVNLVKRGCVVLSYDYFGYGDRKTGKHPDRPEGPNGHGIRSFSYSRRSATALEVLDAIRALDVLTARPDVDPERIGFTGESGGSNTTYWIAALDPRVKLAVPVSSVTTFDYWIRGDINWDWHQRPPGIRRVADIGTLLALHAPRPLVVISSKRGTDDEEFPLPEAEKSHQWARHVYGLYDSNDRVKHYESTTGHGYQEDKRQELYLAVERWLNPPQPRAGQELPAKIEAVEDLRCELPEGNQTFRGIFAEWLKPLPRAEKTDDPTLFRKFLRERLGWPERLPDVQPQLMASEVNSLWTAQFWIIETEPGIRLPVVSINPKNAVSPPLTLVPGRDKSAVSRALKKGDVVVAFDLRGIGEMQSGKGGTWPWMAGEPWSTLLGDSDASWSNWSWFAGRPVPGQWAFDTAQIARFGCDQFKVKSVSIDADNDFGWSSLLAGAAASDLIAAGNATIRRESLQDDIRARGDGALADVPGLLEQLDIQHIRNLWPGHVTVRH